MNKETDLGRALALVFFQQALDCVKAGRFVAVQQRADEQRFLSLALQMDQRRRAEQFVQVRGFRFQQTVRQDVGFV